jgi:S1-C subfamily serine protease
MTDTSSPLGLFSTALADVVAATAPSVVEVASHRSLASGFVWRDNLIITADETLADGGEILVELADGQVHPATLVGRDPATDIALLRVEGVALKSVAFAGAAPRPGALAIAIGAAESAPLVALGSVAAVGGAWRSMRGGEIAARIELDLRLRARGEGGLALDPAHGVLGMTVLGPRRGALVIPGATIDRVASLLLAHGRIPRGYLGLGLREVAIGDKQVGAMVMAVDTDGPGAAAGLHQGDVILSWAGEPIGSVGRLLHSLGPDSIGTTIALGVRRGGQSVDVRITIGERLRR